MPDGDGTRAELDAQVVQNLLELDTLRRSLEETLRCMREVFVAAGCASDFVDLALLAARSCGAIEMFGRLHRGDNGAAMLQPLVEHLRDRMRDATWKG